MIGQIGQIAGWTMILSGAVILFLCLAAWWLSGIIWRIREGDETLIKKEGLSKI